MTDARGRARWSAASSPYPVTCWNCLGEFDATAAVWCSDDSKNPTKLCPFCFRCFCAASEEYTRDFWAAAPARLKEELETLARSGDRLGDILIRTKKITTTQLLDALEEQKATGQKLGELLVAVGAVSRADVEGALRTQGANPLTDTRGVAYAAEPVWEDSDPGAILEYVLSLAARKRASDVRIEPREDGIAVRYRIDDFFFRLDPIPRRFQDALTRTLLEYFELEPGQAARPQTRRARVALEGGDFELIARTMPGPFGTNATIKLVDRAAFVKDLPALGMELEDRVRLLGRVQTFSGLLLLSGPMFNGAPTTAYSLMSFLVRGGRDVLSLESPVQMPIEGARQIEYEAAAEMEATLRDVLSVRPEVVVLFSLPDTATATLAAELASSLLVAAVVPAPSAGRAVTHLLQLGVSPSLAADALSAVTAQRLVRQICRVCRERADPPAPQTLALHGIGPEEAARLSFYRGRGCPLCNRVGYRGRRAIFEVMTASAEVRSAIEDGLRGEALEEAAVRVGMRRLRDHCLALVAEGVTTFDEFVRLRL